MKEQLFQLGQAVGSPSRAAITARFAKLRRAVGPRRGMRRRGGRWRRGVIAGALALAVAGCSSDTPKPAASAPSPGKQPDAARAAAGDAPDAAVAPPKRPALSPGVAEIIQMAQAGVGEKILIEYAQDSPVAYDLTSAEVVYLKDLGISDAVIEAMFKRGRELRARSAGDAASRENAPAATNAPAAEARQPAVYDHLVSGPSPAEPPPPAGTGTVTPPATVTNNYFYGALAPYGSWVRVADYGWCWRPTVAVVCPDWRPYCDNGGWVYTDAGYYWQSCYSWGWAPFHYGRWYLSSRWGWVWRPGCVWGPAWVTWRVADGYYGWAPLPPACGWSAGVGLTWHGSNVSVSFNFGLAPACYTFVPRRYFCHPRVGCYGLTGPQVVNIYQGSTVINNIINGDHNTIVNRGIVPEQLPGPVRSELRRAELRDLRPGSGGPLAPDRYNPRTRRLAVYRPRVPSDLKQPPKGDPRFDPPFHAATRQAAWRPAASARPTATTLAVARSSRARAGTRTVAPGSPGARPTLKKAAPAPGRTSAGRIAPTRHELAARPAPRGSAGVHSRGVYRSPKGRISPPGRTSEAGRFIRPIQPARSTSSWVRRAPTRTYSRPTSGTLRSAAPSRPISGTGVGVRGRRTPAYSGSPPPRVTPPRGGNLQPARSSGIPVRGAPGTVSSRGGLSRLPARAPAAPSVNRALPGQRAPSLRPAAPSRPAAPGRYQPPIRSAPRPVAPRSPALTPRSVPGPRTYSAPATRGAPSRVRPAPLQSAGARMPTVSPGLARPGVSPPGIARPVAPRAFTPVRPAPSGGFRAAPAPVQPLRTRPAPR